MLQACREHMIESCWSGRREVAISDKNRTKWISEGYLCNCRKYLRIILANSEAFVAITQYRRQYWQDKCIGSCKLTSPSLYLKTRGSGRHIAWLSPSTDILTPDQLSSDYHLSILRGSLQITGNKIVSDENVVFSCQTSSPVLT